MKKSNVMIKSYKCVNCGESAAALFKTYGPSVLKLTKCEKCKGFVDKYIEYDPVIVMIDLVLMSKEAQRHVLYNTEFKSYWKLLIILMMLETYGVWRSDSLFNVAVNTLCGVVTNHTDNSTIVSLPLQLSNVLWQFSPECVEWTPHEKTDDTDLFIWEKDFYIKFLSIFAGLAAFILTVQISMQLLKSITSQRKVSPTRLLKAFSLGNAHIVFTLPMLVWGEAAGSTRMWHYCLVPAYGAVLFTSLFTVLYECPTAVTVLVLAVSNIAKYTTSFYITPYLRNFIT